MTILLLPHHKRDSSGHSFSVVNLSDDVISSDVSSSSVSPQTPTKDVIGERVARFLRLTSSASSLVTSPLMKIVLIANLDLGVADDNLRTVYPRGVKSRYSLGIKIEGYVNSDEGDEEQCEDDGGEYDDEHYDDVISRTVKVKRDRIRKRGTKEFTKRGCVYCKYGLGIRWLYMDRCVRVFDWSSSLAFSESEFMDPLCSFVFLVSSVL
ncbi:hypothetical protein F2Q68_00019221 [Brassica cretica]|uniref:Uncharacterized protein n=1 Tax=Brassica cretica TaxID=69181 RepID=A0A8S9G0E4_BRACR|nr:hypothetical protein F2Q68_00019221 [Brassica cretica]